METSVPRTNGKRPAASGPRADEAGQTPFAEEPAGGAGDHADQVRDPLLQPQSYRLPSPGVSGQAYSPSGPNPEWDASGGKSGDSFHGQPESNVETLAAELRREIANRSDLESRLALSEQRLAYMMTSSPLGFFDCDRLSGNAYYSPSYKEMLGYRADELPDRYQTFLDLLHPEDQQSDWLAERQSVGEGMNRFTQYFRLRHKDGTYRWIESTGIEFLDAAATRTRTLGFHLDVTGRKQLEERLHQSEERFHLLITSSPLGFFDTDLLTGRSYLSPLWKSMLGYRPEELADSHQTWLDLLHPDDRAAVIAAHTQRVFGENRRPFSYALRLRHKDGHYHWVQSSGIDFFAADGRLLRSLGFHADIHALKMAEEALESEKEFLGVTLDSISDGVITTDAAGFVTYLNAAAENLCGLRSGEAVHLPIEDFYRRAGAQSRRQSDNPVRAVLTTGLRAAPHDPAYLHAPGRPEKVIADNAAPIAGPAGQMSGSVLVFHDITDRHRAAEELQKAGRIESLGVLAGGMAHDFNNLLTAVLGNMSVARSGGDLPPRAIDALNRAEKACWRARDLTGQLLTFSRGGDPVRKTLALGPLIEQAVRNTVLNVTVQLDFQMDSRLPTVEADEIQLVQVLHNLALNAVQAMPSTGGTLKVITRRMTGKGTGTDREGDGISAAARTAGDDRIEIILRDNGSGILPEHLPKIFDPFFSTRSNGTGLGLAIAYSIIKKHEGTINVDSQPGSGATFTITLPASPLASPPSAEQPADGQKRVGGRILFMDDDPDIRELAGAILGLIGYEPTLTREGSEALTEYQAARACGRPFAAVILDLTIPGGMGGKETMRRLYDLDPNVRAIVSSGYSNDAVIADFRAHGFVAMVAKPYRMEDLARVLHDAITADV